MVKTVLRGPRLAIVELDSEEIFPDDPGNGAPAMVYWGNYSGTYHCVSDTGEMSSGDTYIEVPKRIIEWLHSIEDEVNNFIDTHS